MGRYTNGSLRVNQIPIGVSVMLIDAAKEIERVLTNAKINDRTRLTLQDIVSTLCFYSALLDEDTATEPRNNNVVPFRKGGDNDASD